MRAAGNTNIGLVRKTNEDRLLINQEIRLVVVCDGMGGHKGGDVASSLAIQALNESIVFYDQQEPVRWLNESISRANDLIKQQSKADPELFEMGTTITAAIIKDQELMISHVGDSRLYLINQKGIRQITRDHTLAEKMLEDGLLKPEEMGSNAYNHVLTRALGIEDKLLVDNLVETIAPDDIILLCTDGLTDMLDDSSIFSIIHEFEDNIEGAAQKLIDSALDNGGYDNVTVVLIRV